MKLVEFNVEGESIHLNLERIEQVICRKHQEKEITVIVMFSGTRAIIDKPCQEVISYLESMEVER